MYGYPGSAPTPGAEGFDVANTPNFYIRPGDWQTGRQAEVHAGPRPTARGPGDTAYGRPIDHVKEPTGPLFNGTLDLGEFNASACGADFTKALGRNNRLRGQNYFDESVERDLIGREANRDEKYFTDNLNYGLMNTDQMSAPKQLGGDDPMTSALSSRYDREGTTAIKGIEAENKASAPARQSSQAAIASKHLTDVYQNEVQNYMQQQAYQTKRHQLYTQWVQANRAAQDSMYGNLFGGFLGAAGAIIGGVFGGAAGAQAGGQAGMGIGGAAGTSASQNKYS